MSKKRVLPQHKVVSRSVSMPIMIDDRLVEAADAKKQSVSAYLTDVLKTHFALG